MSWTGSERHRSEKGIGPTAAITADCSVPPAERDHSQPQVTRRTRRRGQPLTAAPKSAIGYTAESGTSIHVRQSRFDLWKPHVLREPVTIFTSQDPATNGYFEGFYRNYFVRIPWSHLSRTR